MDDLLADDWHNEFNEICERVCKYIPRLEMRDHAKSFLRGLVGGAHRKNSWHLAESAGYSRPDSLQRLLAQASWDSDKVRDELQVYIAEKLGEPNGVVIVDETGFLKKGVKSAGVNRQYSGTAGRVENSQIGVFLAYCSSRGSALIDRELYLPQVWIDDKDRRKEAKIPESIEFLTKPQLAVSMFRRVIDSNMPFYWAVGDEVYGRDDQLRQMLEDAGKGYVLAVPCNEHYYLNDQIGTTREHAEQLADEQWQRLSCGSGTKGERYYDWALVAFQNLAKSGFQKALLFRRSIEKPDEIAYYICHYTPSTKIEEVVRVAGSRWAIESAFEQAKQQVGLDQYEVRLWTGWYRHMTLCMFSYAFLEVVRSKQVSKPKSVVEGMPQDSQKN